MTWTLEDHEREAIANSATRAFRSDVVDHALSKLRFNDAEISQDDLQKIGEMLFDHAHELLGKYPEANYKSYVLMVMLYFIQGIEEINKPHMQEALTNDRIGINTRVQCAYGIVRYFMNERSG
ncbi:hypothetical protein [Thalassospira profundimaris]|uniref:hypothetical protein n=1 Tax=Thalassospira profundimaris TaxID=502049 RepID=UPI0011BF5E3B|nr:hypothetical protein [Thalassospira profundimaris]